MTFAVYLPPQAAAGPVPVLYWLSGLTCTDENFVTKAGAQRYAAELGLMIVAPDTSPRGDEVPDDPDGAWDFGLGAGMYVNATRTPWSRHYNMYDYVTRELPALVERFAASGAASAVGVVALSALAMSRSSSASSSCSISRSIFSEDLPKASFCNLAIRRRSA